MAEVNDLPTLAGELADLRRRMEAMETAPRSRRSSVSHGRTIWGTRESAQLILGVTDDGLDVAVWVYDDTVTNRAYIGTVNDGAAAALYLDNPDKSGRAFTWKSDAGMLGPHGIGPWTPNPSQPKDSYGVATVTSPSYQAMHRTIAYVTSPIAHIGIHALRNSGVTSGQVKLTANVVYSSSHVPSGGGEQTVIEQTISDSAMAYDLSGTVPNTIFTPSCSPVGALVLFTLYGRVSAGAGVFELAPTVPLALY